MVVLAILDEQYAFDFVSTAGERLEERIFFEANGGVPVFKARDPFVQEWSQDAIEELAGEVEPEVVSAVLFHFLDWDEESALEARLVDAIDSLVENDYLVGEVIYSAEVWNRDRTGGRQAGFNPHGEVVHSGYWAEVDRVGDSLYALTVYDGRGDNADGLVLNTISVGSELADDIERRLESAGWVADFGELGSVGEAGGGSFNVYKA